MKKNSQTYGVQRQSSRDIFVFLNKYACSWKMAKRFAFLRHNHVPSVQHFAFYVILFGRKTKLKRRERTLWWQHNRKKKQNRNEKSSLDAKFALQREDFVAKLFAISFDSASNSLDDQKGILFRSKWVLPFLWTDFKFTASESQVRICELRRQTRIVFWRLKGKLQIALETCELGIHR